MATNLEEVQEALKAATEPEQSESSTDAKETEVVESPEEKPKGKGKGASDRIQELVADRKAVEAQLEAKETLLAQQQETIDRLTKLATSREADSRVVAKINDLYETADPALKQAIEQLDAALKGQPVTKVTETKADGKDDAVVDALNKTREELQRQQNELREEIADQKANTLVIQADQVIEGLLNALPDSEYNEKDVKLISTLLEDEVDWEAIEENPKVLTKEIEKAFQEVVNWYGDPKGKLQAQVETKQQTDETPKAKEPSLDEILKNDAWGKLKVTGKDKFGNDRRAPAVSDDAFNATLAAVLRESNKR